MKLTKTNTAEVQAEILKRLKDFSQRERIVISLPFGSPLTRIEIYCSETPTKESYLGGKKFNGIVTLQTFAEYDNKANEKSSYSNENELLTFIPKLIDKVSSLIK